MKNIIDRYLGSSVTPVRVTAEWATVPERRSEPAPWLPYCCITELFQRGVIQSPEHRAAWEWTSFFHWATPTWWEEWTRGLMIAFPLRPYDRVEKFLDEVWYCCTNELPDKRSEPASKTAVPKNYLIRGVNQHLDDCMPPKLTDRRSEPASWWLHAS
jgi:hypothetical protein